MLIIKKIKFLSAFKARLEGLRPNYRGSAAMTPMSDPAARWLSLAMAVLLAAGCGPSGSEHVEDYLLRAGKRKVTTHDFIQAVELAKTAYPGGASLGSPALQDVRRQVLDELATELIILNRAEEVGIFISEAELETAISTVKADYPPGAFEQTLVESAVPLGPWKQRMRSRLLLEKLVQVELSGRITVQPEEVADHYRQHYRGGAGPTDSDGQFRRFQETIAADVRRQKLEDAFGDWVQGLKARYPVQVNAQQWERLTNPPGADSAPPAFK